MSRRWTNFVKGPNLQDTITSFSTAKPTTSQTNTEEQYGLRVSLDYEKIISEPSTSTCISKSAEVFGKFKKSSISNRNHNQLNKNAANFNAQNKDSLPSPSEPEPEFATLLKLAEGNHSKKLAKVLEEHLNLDLNRQDEFGWTLLMVSACAGATDCVQLFLRHGANWTIKDKKGLTALTLARKKHFLSICELIQNWEKEFNKKIKIQQQQQQYINSTALEKSSSSSHSQKEKEFCAPCQVETRNSANHNKSISHLLTTTGDVPEKIHYGIPESNRGFQLLIKTGWDRDAGGLGPDGKGQKFPVKTILKQDRVGLGAEEEGGGRKKAKITHFLPFDVSAVERQIKPEERLERKKTVAKKTEAKRKSREVQKEIDYRRELNSL